MKKQLTRKNTLRVIKKHTRRSKMFNSNYIISIYVLVDDFLTPLIQQHPELVPKNKGGFSCAMSPSEIVTLYLTFPVTAHLHCSVDYELALKGKSVI